MSEFSPLSGAKRTSQSSAPRSGETLSRHGALCNSTAWAAGDHTSTVDLDQRASALPPENMASQVQAHNTEPS